MKTIFLLSLLFLQFIPQSLLAQNTFVKIFDIMGWAYGRSICQTLDSGFVIVGTADYPTTGSGNIFIAKTDHAGSVLWNKSIVDLLIEEANSVKQTSDNGFIIAGYYESSPPFWFDGNLIKIDSLGNIEWTKVYLGADAFEDVEQTVDGGYILAGNSNLIRTNSSGDTLWTRRYGQGSLGIPQVLQVRDSNFVFVATKFTIQGMAEILLTKVDTVGDIKWSVKYSDTTHIIVRNFQETDDGGFIISGLIYANNGGLDLGLLLKTDSLGNLLWSKKYPGIRFLFNVYQMADEYIVSGGCNDNNHSQICLLKTDSVGQVFWAKSYGGISADDHGKMVMTNDGGYAITGTTNSFNNFSEHIYLIKTDSLGNSGCFDSSVVFNSINYTITASPHTPNHSSVPINNIINPVFSIVSGLADSILCATIPTGIDESSKSHLNIFPNPTHGDITINVSEETEINSVEVFNILGKLIYKDVESSAEKKNITLTDLRSGIYFMMVIAGKKQYVAKILIIGD